MAATVTLIDGRQVANDSEEWRAECEARAVCKMGGYYFVDPKTERRTWISANSVRQQYVMRVADKRGQQPADELKAAVLRIWDAEFRGR
ncbi:DUF7696 family protein [Bradyrhizobium yuanmingense]|uniref:DUF7696 family protein n=1 Tax=Bradyrhizobium yuanmingense TaxID=108015 RepID=UPI0004BB83F5|nr:hypothetical protein [Bradyrhizobium yuanmingense]